MEGLDEGTIAALSSALSADLCGCTDVIFQQKGHTMTMGFSGASVSFYSAHGCQEGDRKRLMSLSR